MSELTLSGPQLRLIEIASLRVSDEKRNLLDFPAQNAWNEIHLHGDAECLESPKELRVKTEGIDPQLYLPTLEAASEELPLFVELQARVRRCSQNSSSFVRVAGDSLTAGEMAQRDHNRCAAFCDTRANR